MSLPQKLSEIQKAYSSSMELLGADVEVQRIFSVEGAQKGDLVFVSSKEFVKAALDSSASAIVTHSDFAKEFSKKDGVGILTVPNVKLAHAHLKQMFSDRNFFENQWADETQSQRIHSSAVIHETAKVGNGVMIAPNVTVGQGAVIGDQTVIQAGVVIEEGAEIGDNCRLHPNVVIGYNCIIKNNVIIEAGTVIGSEGFGFAQDEKRASHRIPQTGNVIIEENVRIGSNNSIDRATYLSTRIGAGTKTDNLCHFAHNVEIGKDCLITSMFCIAGTSKVGDRVIASGQSGVIDHINICDDVVLLHRAGVTKDITEPGMYSALPHQPFAQYTKNMAQFRKLGELAKRVKKLEN